MPLSKKVKVKDALALQYEKTFTAFFRMQKTILMRKLTARALSAKTRQLADPPSITLEAFDEIWSDVEKRTTAALKEAIVNAEADGLHAGANSFKDALVGVDPSKKAGTTFNLANPRAVSWFHERGGSVDYIKGIQDTTKESLKRVITTGLDEGWSYNQTAKEIQKLFDGPISRDRAQRIAVYETAQAYEQGNMLFAQSLKDDGVEMEKMYQTSEDALVSDLCRGNQDDGWIPIDQYHRSGVQEPPGHVNCRCYEKYRQRGSP